MSAGSAIRLWLIVLVWVVYGGMQVWMIIHHWVVVGVITAFAGSLLAGSATNRLVTGRWIDYSVLWRR